jgi:ubiquinone/menaquinone biosynthesis C-methylase UbiE
MAYQRFAAAIHVWLAERHGAGHPLYPFWVQDHLTKVERLRQYYLPILEQHADTVPSKVVDIGCGTGAACVAFGSQGLQVVGVDCSREMLNLARLRSEEDGTTPTFIQADGLWLPFADGGFDLCVCDQVIEHVQGYSNLLAEIFRILRPGGLMIVSAPQRLAVREGHSGLLCASWFPHKMAQWYVRIRGRRKASDSWDVWLETPWSIRRKIRRAGFEELRSPWRQPAFLLDDKRILHRIVANFRPLWPLARVVARWKGFLLGTVTFLAMKPGSERTAKRHGAAL